MNKRAWIGSLVACLVWLSLFTACAPETPAPETKPMEEASAVTQETTSEPTPTPTPVKYDPVEPMDFTQLLREVNTARREAAEEEHTFEGFEQYLVNDPAVVDLLTDQEVKELLTSQSPRLPEYITYEQAVYDVDLLFRAFHAGYGAYYFFGEDAFQQAEAEVLDWLKGQERVYTVELRDELRDSTDFMRDGHSWIAKSTSELKDLWYKYYQCDDQSYAKDEVGYYKTENGEKWYFVSFSQDKVTMSPTLLTTGELVYAPVLFCPAVEMENGSVVLRNVEGVERTERLIWKTTTAYGYKDHADFKFLKEGGLSYISIRDFHQERDPEAFEQFVLSGAQAKDSKLLIFDLRSNGGGNSGPLAEWTKNFAGQEPSFKVIKAIRHSVLAEQGDRDGLYKLSSWYNTVGNFVENDVPIIVLVDDKCGSAGETALHMMKAIDNVLVVGSNSGGYQLGGSDQVIWLPNSHIPSQMGTELCCFYGMETGNVDCIGWEPDVWCNPETALEAVLNMVKEYGLADALGADKIYEALDGVVINHKNIALKWTQWTVPAGANFGGGIGCHAVTVMVNGVATNDFTVESSNPEMCTCTKTGKGMFVLNCTQPGESWLTITCGKASARFRWIT